MAPTRRYHGVQCHRVRTTGCAPSELEWVRSGLIPRFAPSVQSDRCEPWKASIPNHNGACCANWHSMWPQMTGGVWSNISKFHKDGFCLLLSQSGTSFLWKDDQLIKSAMKFINLDKIIIISSIIIWNKIFVVTYGCSSKQSESFQKITSPTTRNFSP